MAISIVLIAIIIGMLFLFALYMYDNSQFSKITGYSLIDLWTDSKIKILYKIVQALPKENGDYKILYNLILPNTNRKVDMVILHEAGVFVIDIRNLGGWIYGREQDSLWAQALHKDKLIKFNNPIIDNKLAILDLIEAIPNLTRGKFHSLIVFTDKCSFNKIEIHSQNVDVLKFKELKNYWKNDFDKKLTTEEINKIYNVLEKYMNFKETKKQLSINNITAN